MRKPTQFHTEPKVEPDQLVKVERIEIDVGMNIVDAYFPDGRGGFNSVFDPGGRGLLRRLWDTLPFVKRQQYADLVVGFVDLPK